MHEKQLAYTKALDERRKKLIREDERAADGFKVGKLYRINIDFPCFLDATFPVNRRDAIILAGQYIMIVGRGRSESNKRFPGHDFLMHRPLLFLHGGRIYLTWETKFLESDTSLVS